MFGLKTKPEVKDTLVVVQTSLAGHEQIGENEFGEPVVKAFDRQPGSTWKIGKTEASRMIARGYAIAVTPEQETLHNQGLAEWDQTKKRWQPTPAGTLAMSSATTTASTKKMLSTVFA